MIWLCSLVSKLFYLNLIGTSGINWVSADCGGNIRALNAGKKV